jgi:hypothetical protein
LISLHVPTFSVYVKRSAFGRGVASHDIARAVLAGLRTLRTTHTANDVRRAASNELPEGKELAALFDRFLLRFDVGYLLVAANLRGLLVGPEPAIAATLTMDELRRAQSEVAAVKVTDDTVDALLAIRDACRGEGITASDRRWKKALGIVRASAWLAGEKKTGPEDLAILVDSLWREPKERAKVARIVGNLADPASMQSVEILDAAREIATQVAGLKAGDRKLDIAQAAQAVEQFDAQQVKLQELAKSGGRRAKAVIGDAVAELQGLHAVEQLRDGLDRLEHVGFGASPPGAPASSEPARSLAARLRDDAHPADRPARGPVPPDRWRQPAVEGAPRRGRDRRHRARRRPGAARLPPDFGGTIF